MKLKLLSLALCVSLSACTTSQLNNDEAISTQSIVATGAEIAQVEASSLTEQKLNKHYEITLERIMADPDWMGRSPESWYWGDDNHTVFYKQKQLGNPLRDLYQVDVSSNDAKMKTDTDNALVALSDLHQVEDKNAQTNQDGTHEIYIFKGNVFVKTIATKQVKQLTNTSSTANAAMFLLNGDVAYRIGDRFFSHNLTNGLVTELANLVLKDEKPSIKEPTSYIGKEQHKLIEYIALEHRNSKLREQQKQRLIEQNDTISDTSFYLGKNKRIRHASLSPRGDKLFVSITDSKPSRAATDIMPNYITPTGDIAAEKVRARVANNRKYEEQLFIIDLKTRQKNLLSYNTLPDYDTDVLASVKRENHQKKGLTYSSKPKARNIHLLQMRDAVKWSADGSEVALMLEAWDNKTRWLTTVDFDDNRLITQHKLHDDAWINWNFNEFGWMTNNNKFDLYFLSEQSGYSQLYVKSLSGKTEQLTSGRFEVSNVHYSKLKQHFTFKANKKHPGIYEIYQVDLTKRLTALTNLGGMNDYQLSPDESKLLIEHSTITMPPELYVIDMNSSNKAQRITYTVSDEFLAMPWVAPNVVAIPSSKQDMPIYSRVYLPENYDLKKNKNKAVMFNHGAGYLQNAHLGWSGYFREFMFHSMLVQQGYVVIDMDYRASKGYGRDWRTAIYRHMGSVEVEDMSDGVNWLIENANVAPERIGTYGGSYGGFLTLMSMFTQPELFASGAALRLVSDWAYYNHGYTSNILNTPEDDAIAYERSSPIYFAQGLAKPLLINAPMVDDNVFFEDSVRLVQRLIELEKQDFETAIYPVEPHGFVQPSSWLDEYRRIYKLFETTL